MLVPCQAEVGKLPLDQVSCFRRYPHHSLDIFAGILTPSTLQVNFDSGEDKTELLCLLSRTILVFSNDWWSNHGQNKLRKETIYLAYNSQSHSITEWSEDFPPIHNISVWTLHCRVGIKFKQKIAGYYQKISIAVEPVTISFQDSFYYNSKIS